MKLYEYLKISPAEFQTYIDSGMISVNHHAKFPLVLFSYSRQAQYENLWPDPVRKCRGLIVNELTEEIIARPFEKFFNLENDNLETCLVAMSGHGAAEESKLSNIAREPDFIYEKMDGFMCTLYTWEGVNYIASKGSFDSPHAKWATATYRKYEQDNSRTTWWPEGFTPVFEGLTANLRIVVDYKDREELVLIGLVNIETGEEIIGRNLLQSGMARGFSTPKLYALELAAANQMSLDPSIENFEGYVAVWVRPGQTPFRLKIKFIDYLRIHRMVTGVSPKRIFEALVNNWQSVLAEWTDESTPWFKKHIAKWQRALVSEYEQIERDAKAHFELYKAEVMKPRYEEGKFDYFPTRKDWALKFQESSKQIQPILFALLDGKDVKPFIWKQVKPMIRNSRPLVDSHSI